MIDFLKRMAEYSEKEKKSLFKYEEPVYECSNCGRSVKKGIKFCSTKCQKEGRMVYRCPSCGRVVLKRYNYCKGCQNKRKLRGITLGKMKVARKSPTTW